MKEPTPNGRELLPLSVMEAAHAGNMMAMEQVLRYHEGYINKLYIHTLYNNNGIPYVYVDEYVKHRLEIKLIHSIIVASKQRPGHGSGNVLLLSFHISASPVADVYTSTGTPTGQWRRVIGHTDIFCLHRTGWRMRHNIGLYENSGAAIAWLQNKCSCLQAMTCRQDNDTPLQPQSER